MNCQPVLSLSRSRNSSKTSLQAQAWSTALSVRTPSRSKRQALMVLGRPSIFAFSGTGESHGTGWIPRSRARRTSISAVCWRSCTRSLLRRTSSEAENAPSAALSARSAESRANCHRAVIVSRSGDCSGRETTSGMSTVRVAIRATREPAGSLRLVARRGMTDGTLTVGYRVAWVPIRATPCRERSLGHCARHRVARRSGRRRWGRCSPRKAGLTG